MVIIYPVILGCHSQQSRFWDTGSPIQAASLTSQGPGFRFRQSYTTHFTPFSYIICPPHWHPFLPYYLWETTLHTWFQHSFWRQPWEHPILPPRCRHNWGVEHRQGSPIYMGGGNLNHVSFGQVLSAPSLSAFLGELISRPHEAVFTTPVLII